MRHSSIYRLLLLFLGVHLAGYTFAETWYTGQSDFRHATFENNILQDHNSQAGFDVVNTVMTPIYPGSNTRPIISLRLTNLNHIVEKKYPVYELLPTGEKKESRVKNPMWGVVWGYGDRENFHALLLRSGERDPFELNPPTLQYRIITVIEGDTLPHTPWQEIPTEEYINPESGYNELLINPINGGFELFIGEDAAYRLGICRDDRLFGERAGVYIGSGAHILLKEWVVSSAPYIERTPYWEPQQLSQYLKEIHNTDPYLGIYEILGSESNNLNMRLGGDYKLALVSERDRLLLLYLSGAQRATDQWKAGMIKAILTPTDNPVIFNMVWYDSNHRLIQEGTKASFGTDVLNLYLLHEGVVIRCTKIALPLKEKEAYFLLL